MAALKENLMSLGNLTGTDRNTFTKQKQHSLKHSREMHLQRRWQELKERECSAQQHNKQLLRQFDRAQDALRELVARNAAMKTVRMEYEKYLDTIHWQQQIKEKTAQRKMEEYLISCLKNSEEEQMRKSSAEQLLQGLKPQNCSAVPEKNKQNSCSYNNQEVSSQQPFQSSWQTHTQPQSARFPTNMPLQPQGSSLDHSSHLPPPSTLPYSHQFHHLTPMLAHHALWARQDQPGWASLQSDNPWSWTTGATGIPSASKALWGQLNMDEPPHVRLLEAETRRASRETGGESRSSHCSQELDINPVRLCSGQAESSESGRDSSRSSREKRKKREKTKRTSSDRESCSSQDSSQTSSAIVKVGDTVVQSSESEASCGKHRTRGGERTKRRNGGLAAGSPQIEKVANDTTESEGDNSESHKEESHSTGEESGSQSEDSRSQDAENQSPVDKSEEESGSDSVKVENEDAEKEMQESNSGAEQNSEEEMDEEEEEHKNDLGDGEGKKKSQRDEEKDVRHVDDDDDDDEVSGRKNTTEEDETGTEDELVDQGDDEERFKDEDGEKRKQGSASSQSEEGDERVENQVCEGEEGSDEEEGGEEEEDQRSDEAGEEESDSDDSIISPQENRLKKIHIIQEEEDEDDEEDDKSGSKPGSPEGDEFSEDDIENLLAPQEQRKTTDKNPKVEAKATCDYVEIFQAEDNSTKTDRQSDSDEFDHFYD